mgnify:CR=1 FL=1
MPKRLRSFPLYIAPEIKGRIGDNGEPKVLDEKTGQELDPTNIDHKIIIYERQVKGELQA